jgi:hypothetical protein
MQSRASTKKASITQTNIHRSSAIGKMLENSSSHKAEVDSMLIKPKLFTVSSGQKTKKHNHGKSLTRLNVYQPSTNTRSAQKIISYGKTSITNHSGKGAR